MSGIDGLALPKPIINNISLGTTAETLYKIQEGQVIDFLIQNLSANIVYLLQEPGQPIGSALRIAAGGNMSDENWTGDLIIIASGAASDIRYMIKIHGYPWQNIKRDWGEH